MKVRSAQTSRVLNRLNSRLPSLGGINAVTAEKYPFTISAGGGADAFRQSGRCRWLSLLRWMEPIRRPVAQVGRLTAFAERRRFGAWINPVGRGSQ